MNVDPATIRRLRERRGWQQKDLARAAGLSKPYISQLESGARQPSAVVAKALTRALGVTIDELAERPVICPSCGTVFVPPR